MSSQFWNQAGEWAFKQRSWLPVPIALILLASRHWHIPGDIPIRVGIILVAFGEFLRFWTVRQIGVISRTRSARWGPLVVSGPYRIVRNPIYVGNWFLWTGFVVWSGLLWMLPVAWLLFGLQYAAIVRWEEQRLLAHFGDPYADYLRSVPRWFPGVPIPPPESPGAPHPWNEVLFSERGTLAAIVAMAILLTLKFLYLR
ncbi:MAG: isoprenylcysteine carboxylmethyltransferase family protein [Vicinamibacterales bacterium]